jgi:hypothetical protein
MPYFICPQCHASYHAGVLYVQHESCPRCGARFAEPRRGLASTVLRRRRPAQAPDWEAITGSQYERRRYVERPDHELDPDDGPPPDLAA